MSTLNFNTWLQSRLTSHGFAVGPIDGVLGPATFRAISAFQRSTCSKPSGLATPETVIALRQSSTGAVPRPTGPEQTTPSNPWVIDTRKLGLQPNRWPLPSEIPAFYGAPGNSWTQIELPYRMVLAWDKSIIARRMTVHERVASSVLRCLGAVAQTYSATERTDLGLDLFGGSANIRKKRGGTTMSVHAVGAAIDFDPERNGLHTPFAQARLGQPDALPFWQIWEAESWTSLGRTWGRDAMHVEATRR